MIILHSFVQLSSVQGKELEKNEYDFFTMNFILFYSVTLSVPCCVYRARCETYFSSLDCQRHERTTQYDSTPSAKMIPPSSHEYSYITSCTNVTFKYCNFTIFSKFIIKIAYSCVCFQQPRNDTKFTLWKRFQTTTISRTSIIPTYIIDCGSLGGGSSLGVKSLWEVGVVGR